MTSRNHRITDRMHLDISGIEPPSAILRRFGVEVLAVDLDAATTAMAMPIGGLTSPLTGAPTVAPLAFLVDLVGVVGHFRRHDDEWTVSSELTMELAPDAIDAVVGDDPVVVSAQSLGDRTGSALSTCKLSCGATAIGVGTVRSVFMPAGAVRVDDLDDHLARTIKPRLADLMAVRVVHTADGSTALAQDLDSTLNNALGIVHGGIASAGLELVAAAVACDDGPPMRTASLSVNFLRPFNAGDGARYEAKALRIGRRSAIADAQAINGDGTVAMIARLTAYR